eukprot:g43448.t1
MIDLKTDAAEHRLVASGQYINMNNFRKVSDADAAADAPGAWPSMFRLLLHLACKTWDRQDRQGLLVIKEGQRLRNRREKIVHQCNIKF